VKFQSQSGNFAHSRKTKAPFFSFFHSLYVLFIYRCNTAAMKNSFIYLSLSFVTNEDFSNHTEHYLKASVDLSKLFLHIPCKHIFFAAVPEDDA
jgi:hypothetical protein